MLSNDHRQIKRPLKLPTARFIPAIQPGGNAGDGNIAAERRVGIVSFHDDLMVAPLSVLKLPDTISPWPAVSEPATRITPA